MLGYFGVLLLSVAAGAALVALVGAVIVVRWWSPD